MFGETYKRGEKKTPVKLYKFFSLSFKQELSNYSMPILEQEQNAELNILSAVHTEYKGYKMRINGK